MNHFFIILFVAAFFQLFPVNGSAKNWNSWQRQWGQGNQPAKDKAAGQHSAGSGENDQKATRKERYCSYEQEGELLQLLKELKELAQSTEKKTGKQSIVRQKYRIAKKLSKFDDCRAEDALKELVKENACEDLGEGEVYCVAWGATPSLQDVQSKKDLKKLTPKSPLDDQLTVIKKYGQHPHKNEVASHAVRDFLIDQSPSNPEIYVPLLLEYFVHSPQAAGIARQFPRAADVGLQRCLLSSHSSTVWHGIQLARILDKSNLLEAVFGVAFEKKGNFDYSQQERVETIQTAALSFLRIFESQSLSYYQKILFGEFPKMQEYLVSGIRDFSNPELLNILKAFESQLRLQPDRSLSFPLERLQKKISLLEEAQK